MEIEDFHPIDTCRDEFDFLGDDVGNFDPWTGDDLKELNNVKELVTLPFNGELDSDLCPITPDIFNSGTPLQSEESSPRSDRMTRKLHNPLAGFSLVTPDLDGRDVVCTQYTLSLKSLEQKMRKSAESRQRLHDLCKGMLTTDTSNLYSTKVATKEPTKSKFPSTNKRGAGVTASMPDKKRSRTERVVVGNRK